MTRFEEAVQRLAEGIWYVQWCNTEKPTLPLKSGTTSNRELAYEGFYSCATILLFRLHQIEDEFFNRAELWHDGHCVSWVERDINGKVWLESRELLKFQENS
jgi:hypothetical protein